MSLAERLDREYIDAYKAKDSLRLSVLRLLKTSMTNYLVEQRRPGGTLSDEEIMTLIVKQAKQRQDSIEQFTAANRKDLADKEAAELKILQQYLPSPLSPMELDDAIDKAITATGATGPKEMGKVISAIMAEYKGRVDGKMVSETVRKKLIGR